MSLETLAKRHTCRISLRRDYIRAAVSRARARIRESISGVFYHEAIAFQIPCLVYERLKYTEHLSFILRFLRLSQLHWEGPLTVSQSNQISIKFCLAKIINISKSKIAPHFYEFYGILGVWLFKAKMSFQKLFFSKSIRFESCRITVVFVLVVFLEIPL